MKERYLRFLSTLHDRYENGGYICGAGVGSGLSAKGAVKGGADFLACYSTAVYRTLGLPTSLSFLPYDDCNKITANAFPCVRAASGGLSTLIGMGSHDPRFSPERMVDLAESLGADGTVNEFFIGYFRNHMLKKDMDALGLGFTRELEFIQKTLDRGMLTLTWTFGLDEIAAVAAIGSPMIGIMLSEELAGMKNARDYKAEVDYVIKMTETALKENPDALVFVHGRVVETYEDVQYILQRTPAHGYFTGSAGERIPVVPAIATAISSFRNIPFVAYEN